MTISDSPVRSLCESLEGDWAILFSNPEDFAPHPSTPAGFHAQIAAQFAELRVKPLALATSADEPGHRWLRDVAGAGAVDPFANARLVSPFVDFASRALEVRLRALDPPYVAMIDAAGRCRLTILYQRHRTDRPRTLEELLRIVNALRAGEGSVTLREDRTRPEARKIGRD